MERIKFVTKSGSIYVIDRDTMTWYRQGDGPIESTGLLDWWPHVELDERLVLRDSEGPFQTTAIQSITRTHVEIPDIQIGGLDCE
jgi:hypothetical protein